MNEEFPCCFLPKCTVFTVEKSCQESGNRFLSVYEGTEQNEGLFHRLTRSCFSLPGKRKFVLIRGLVLIKLTQLRNGD